MAGTEECDDGASNGTGGSCCNANCTFTPADTVCRPSAGGCDVAEVCSGSSGACPPDNNPICTPTPVPTNTPDRCAGVTCAALNQCHLVGTCDPATGQCLSPPAPSGTECNDGNPCTQTDACDGNGSCVGTDPVVCAPLDQCHLAGECDPTSGCSNPVALDGTACDAGNACPQPDTCQLGTCIATQCVSAPVIAGGTVTTDTQGHGATPTEPVQTSVTSPDAGTVAITETAATGTPPTGFALVGEQVTVSAPAAAPDVPLVLVFLIDASRIPAGADQNAIQIFKDGVLVPACAGAPGVASPDPCVSDRQLLTSGDVQITVLTSTASVWTFAVQSVCGNEILEFGEQCDDGVANGTVASCCNANCQFQANGTSCTDANPCTANDTCSAGTCVSGPATDCDDNNPCTADSCDPVAGCEHSMTCASNLLPGGGRAKTDCMQEWLSQAQPTNARRNRLVCTDDDPACDFGTTTGACTFHIAMCFNVNASPGACTGTDVEHVTVTQPGPKPANAAGALNRTAMDDALVELGGTVQGTCKSPRAKRGQFCQQNSDCDSAPGKGNGVCKRVVKFGHLSTVNACTPFADIAVPLRQSHGRLRAATKTLRLSVTPNSSRSAKDSDALTLVCRPK